MPRRAMPTWLMAILFAAGFVAIAECNLPAVSSSKTKSAEALSKPSANAENAAAKPGGPVHPLQKYIEISGIRFQQDARNKKLITVTFELTNHWPRRHWAGRKCHAARGEYAPQR